MKPTIKVHDSRVVPPSVDRRLRAYDAYPRCYYSNARADANNNYYCRHIPQTMIRQQCYASPTFETCGVAMDRNGFVLFLARSGSRVSPTEFRNTTENRPRYYHVSGTRIISGPSAAPRVSHCSRRYQSFGVSRFNTLFNTVTVEFGVFSSWTRRRKASRRTYRGRGQ